MAISSLRKLLFITAGSLSLTVGVIGIFVPLLPTTVFLLIAAACYARSSDRLYGWLLSHPVLGTYIRTFRERRGMPRHAKAALIVVLWATLAYTAYAWGSLAVGAGLLAVAVGVTVCVLRMETLTS